ncbi:hypothetical protein [Nonomuraea rhizosphaerae]|uniref:hypothetical protein n=1 Tax=Nonomuraea rhizosphaerae TaxID=2665663 RepID=UPI001C5D9C3C|nr:hypothetical protein [Nonomuraea rhizosphaerae]
MNEDDGDLWPVVPSELVSETLSDMSVSAETFSTVVALTVALCEDPWLIGSEQVGSDPDWREVLIPKGYGIAEYRIDRKNQQVVLTRIVLF